MRTLATATTLAVLTVFTASTAAAYAQTPMKEIRKTNDRLNTLLRKKAPEGSTAHKKIKAKLKRTVNGFLDFKELARRALGRHWKKRSTKERDEFVQLLSDLIERNYVKQLRGNLSYKLEYRNEKVKGTKARVVTAVKVVKDGRTEEVVIEYKMYKKSGKWRVYDVITDDVSVVRNYRSQFNRIIKKKSYEHLVKKMKKKLKRI